MFRIFAAVLVVGSLAAPLAAQTDYTWNPASTGSHVWDTTSAVWSTSGVGGPFDKTFFRNTTGTATLSLASGTANLTAGDWVAFGQLRIGSDGFTLTNGTGGNEFTLYQGFRTVGGARTLNLAVAPGTSGTSSPFGAGGTGDTSAGKLTINLSSAVSGYGIDLGPTAFGTAPNAEVIANSTTGGANGGTRVSFGGVMPAGVSLTLTSNATGDIRSTLRAFGGGTWNGPVNLTGTGVVQFDSFVPLVVNGPVSSGAHATTLRLTQASAGTLAGVMSGAMGLTTESSASGWRITQPANTFTGPVTVNGLYLFVTKLADAGVSSSLGAGTGPITFGTAYSPALIYEGDTASSTNRGIHLPGGTTATLWAAGLTPTASVSFTGAFTTGGGTSSRRLELTGANTGANTVASSLTDGAGTLSVWKYGTGNWILSGTNTYTGSTWIESGTLSINGNHSASSGVVSVGGGSGSGTLAGTGTIGRLVFVSSGGTVRGDSGTGTGNLTLLADTTIDAGPAAARGTLRTQLTTSGGAITANSKLALIGAGADLNFANLSGSNTFAIALGNDAGLTLGQSYTITLATAAASTNFQRNGNGGAAFTAADFTLVSGAWAEFKDVSLVRNGTQLQLTFTPVTPVPEPATVGLVVAAGGLLIAARRRRGRNTIPG